MKKKILSLALACIMLVSAFAAMLPVSATDTAFTVTSSSGGTIGNYSKYEEAIAAVYTAAKSDNKPTYTIKFNTDYTTSSGTIYANTDVVNAKIVIDGNGKTFTSSSTSTAAFKFIYGGSVTVQNLTVLTSGRVAEVYRGTSLKFTGCTLTSKIKLGSDSVIDYGGFFRTPNDTSATSTCNYLALENCSIALENTASNTSIFGHTSQENIMNVSLKGVSADISTCTNVKLFAVRGRANPSTLSIDSCDIKLANTAFTNICQSNISITGTAEKHTTITTTGTFFQMDSDNAVNDASLFVGDNVTLKGAKLFDANGTGRKLNVHTTNRSFYYTDNNSFKAPTLEVGASVRTTAHSNGLRFTANLVLSNTDKVPDTCGMLITRTESINKAGAFTVGALVKAGEKYTAFDADSEKIIDGKYYVALTGIPDIGQKYSVIAYSVYDMGDGVSLRYYDADAYNETDNSRSIAQVAYEAVNDTSETRTDTHTCKIADNKYSPYSKAQFSILDGRYACRYDPTNDAVSAKTNANMWTESTEEDILVRDITIDNGDDTVDDITVIQLTDLHLVYANDTDRANATLNATYNERVEYWGKARTNAENALAWAENADQIVLTGDIYDFLTSEVVSQANSFIFSAYTNIMACLGNHDPVYTMNDTLNQETVTERMDGNWYVPAEDEGDMFYSSKVIENKVMLIQMDNGSTGEFLDCQVEALERDLKEARMNGYIVLIFYHIPLCTGDPEDTAIESSKYDDSTPSVKNFYKSAAGNIYRNQGEATQQIYDMIVSNGDIIKGAFCGHLHSDFYTELQATTADGMYTVIPQYVLRGNSYENGHALRITVK